MINCNPETVSTDYDTSNRLYFEPLTLEDVLEVIHAETLAGPLLGVITQLGGQTPLGLAAGLKANGVTILGTSPEAINLAEERGAFGQILADQELNAPEFGMASSQLEAITIASRIGYPVLVRPSFVLGGRGMEIVYDDNSLAGFISRATDITPDHPVLVDRFLDSAIEIDVDALFDGNELFLGGVMEHIEEAGIHSGDSACVLPSMTITELQLQEIKVATTKIAQGVGVLGLINIQFAIAGEILYVLEANPRASRTVPFVSKATGVALAKAAARISLGATIAELRVEGILPVAGDGVAKGISVKEAVLPWNRFRRSDGRGVDAILGPEMRSTGEVMGISPNFGESYAKSQIAAFGPLPKSGTVFISLADKDKASGIDGARGLASLGFRVLATAGTAQYLAEHGVVSVSVRKNSDGTGALGEPTIVEIINSGEIDLVINTPVGRGTRADGWLIRTAAVQRSIPIITTTAGFSAAVEGIRFLQNSELSIKSLQEWLA
jgi:carbamoyl-phosphate synthase large subunit